MKLSKSILILFIFISFLSGCGSMRQPRTLKPQHLEPSETLRFSDVPFPAGFKILRDKSFILESGGVRAGVLRYTGRANVEDVIRFYKEQMAVYNWALLNIIEYGEQILNFERENESCIVTLTTKGGRIDISVSLAPKSPISLPKRETKEAESLVVKPKNEPKK